MSFVDVGSLRPLKVVADTANGMGGLVVPIVFERLPFAVEILFPELDGNFPNHPADPIQPENLVALKAAVLEQGADIGLAFDGDADRVFLVDEKAEPVSGSLTTALVAASMLTKHPGETILYNLICSHVVPEVVTEMGGTPVRTQVGHSIIKKVMAETGAVFGGEHSGHYYYRDNFRADSGIITALLVLELLSQSDAAALRDAPALPALRGLGGDQHRRSASPAATVAAIAEHERKAGASVDMLDGLTVEHGDWWYNVRPSNTEPLLRLNVEAKTAERCAAHVAEVQQLIATHAGLDGRPELRSSPMSLDPLLLDVLACPVDKGPLLWFEDEDVLYNPRLQKSYAVVDGVPVLLATRRPTVGERRARAPAGQGRERQGAGHGPGPWVSEQAYLDTLGMWEAAAALPEQLSGALRAAEEAFGGMLGSVVPTRDARLAVASPVAAFGLGTGGDGLRGGGRPCGAGPDRARSGSAPGPPLPAFVGPDTLVLAVSPSGGTAETLAAAEKAVERGATVVARRR